MANQPKHDGDLNAIISLFNGTPRRAALTYCGYSEKARTHKTKKLFHNPRLQIAAKRVGLALLTETNPEYRHIAGIFEDRNAAPTLVLETAQQLHDEWVRAGRPETPGFAALPEISRVMLIGTDGEAQDDLSLVPFEKVTPQMVGTKALQLLWNELLDPPADARTKMQVISKGLEVRGLIGDHGELHLHAHRERLDAQTCKLIAKAVRDAFQEPGRDAIDLERVQ